MISSSKKYLLPWETGREWKAIIGLAVVLVIGVCLAYAALLPFPKPQASFIFSPIFRLALFFLGAACLILGAFGIRKTFRL